jgi:hypothetical protein
LTQNRRIQQLLFFSLLLVVLAGCHQGLVETSTPNTNNPELIGYKEEWKPDANEPWWKVSMYETLKSWEEEKNQ